MSEQPDPDMLEEHDFTDGVRGKYADQYAAASNVVVMDPDVAERFHSARDVNEALRELLRLKRAVGDAA